MPRSTAYHQPKVERIHRQVDEALAIRVPQRRACGYRDEGYLKLKIVAAFLPALPKQG